MNTNTLMKQLIISFIFLLFASVLCAQESQKDIGNYSVHYSVFNSSFLPEEAAAGYGFVRAGDRAILNIAVTEKDAGGLSRGLPVELKASVANLLQQSTDLTFVEIDEGDATYYLAEFEFPDQDALNFTVHVLLPGERYSDTVTFSKTLYHD